MTCYLMEGDFPRFSQYTIIYAKGVDLRLKRTRQLLQQGLARLIPDFLLE